MVSGKMGIFHGYASLPEGILGGISLNLSFETWRGTGEHAKRPEMHSWLESP